MRVYVRRTDTPDTPIIGENWSKLVETDQFQPVSPKYWYQFYTRNWSPVSESGVLF